MAKIGCKFFQTTTMQGKVNRSDHVWFQKEDGTWKCCLCGGVCIYPTAFPTSEFWMPDRFEKLKDDERTLCKYVEGSGSS